MALFPPRPRAELTDELRDVVRLLGELENENLTDWEFEFVTSLHDRIEKYQGEALISAGQGEWLSRLAEKYDLRNSSQGDGTPLAS